MRVRRLIVVILGGLILVSVLIALATDTWYQEPEYGPHELEMSDVNTTCQQHCEQIQGTTGVSRLSAKVEYCVRKFSVDIDDDGLYGTAGSGYNTYCEDGIHCFNIHSCQVYGGELTASECRDTMITYYQNVSEVNRTEAVNWTKSWFMPDGEQDRTIGTCGLQNETQETWYSENFAR